MTDTEFILSELVFKKIQNNEPFSFYNLYQSILNGEQENYSQVIFNDLIKLTNENKPTIKDFFLDNDYIIIYDPKWPKYILTDNGKKAKELGGHKQYLSWKAKQKRKNFLIDFPKNYWYVIAIVGFFIGKSWDFYFNGTSAKQIKNVSKDTIQKDKTIKALRDSVQDLIRQQKEILNIYKNRLSIGSDSSKK